MSIGVVAVADDEDDNNDNIISRICSTRLFLTSLHRSTGLHSTHAHNLCVNANCNHHKYAVDEFVIVG